MINNKTKTCFRECASVCHEELLCATRIYATCDKNVYRRFYVESNKNALHFYTESQANMDIRAGKSRNVVCSSLNVQHNLLSTGRNAECIQTQIYKRTLTQTSRTHNAISAVAGWSNEKAALWSGVWPTTLHLSLLNYAYINTIVVHTGVNCALLVSVMMKFDICFGTLLGVVFEWWAHSFINKTTIGIWWYRCPNLFEWTFRGQAKPQLRIQWTYIWPNQMINQSYSAWWNLDECLEWNHTLYGSVFAAVSRPADKLWMHA